MAVVLKQFPWSPNGHTVEMLNPGDRRDFGSAEAGLRDEGYVELEQAVTPVEPPSEPALVAPVSAPLKRKRK